MGYVISKLEIEGIRGVNSKLEQELPLGLVVIRGKNGTGKTSILQSIEWCLTGRFPFFQGTEFRKEDAIVNPYNAAKKATVSLTLSDQAKRSEVKITRTRKMGSSTTEKSELQIQLENGKSLRQEEAQDYIEKILGVALDDFPRAVYLHQEALHALVSEKPEQRSAAIDKLLGTAELRELVDVLNLKRTIPNTIEDLQGRVDTFERERIRYAVGMRKRLADTKQRLMQKGHSENSLEASSVASQIKLLHEQLAKLATSSGVELEELAMKGFDPESLTAYLLKLQSDRKTVERARTDKLRLLEQQMLRIESKAGDFERESAVLANRGNIDLDLLRSQLDAAKKELDDVRTQVGKLTPRSASLQSAQVKIAPLEGQIQNIDVLLENYRKKFGDEAVLKQEYGSLNTRLKDNAATFEKLGKLEQIISLSIGYIEQHRPDKCPVCAQTITPDETIRKLRDEAISTVSDLAKRVIAERDQLLAQSKSIKSTLDDYDRAASEFATAKSRMNTILREAAGSTGETLTLDSFKERLAEASAKLDELKLLEATKLSQAEHIQVEYDKVDVLLRQVKNSFNNLQSLLDTQTNDRAELLKMSKSKVEELTREAEQFRDTQQLDFLEQNASKMQELIQYLKDKDEVEVLDNDLPNVESRIEELMVRIDSLRKLDGSLAAIRGVAAQAQKELVNEEFRSLENLLNKYFGKLLSHPAFPTLTLSIEKEEPLQYSIKATGPGGATYVPTRFSTAQLNSVAIAIFLSNHEKLVGSLSTLIFDDPSQSMDPEHKQRLTETLKSLLQGRQIIVATQDEELSNDLCKSEAAKIIELGPWTMQQVAVAK